MKGTDEIAVTQRGAAEPGGNLDRLDRIARASKARQDGRVLDCIGFDLGHLLYRLTPGEANLDIAYVIEENEWRGRKGIQLRIRDLR